ncbi:peptidase M23 [Micromonospora sp. NBC_01813]|uniref:peptidase M23 n=1 Tax=Micromonospora sp. NBC_01813 TaxID=2975988 RepID=UPI002DDAF142|nr:peptidase M23 [Micromonospora sp. NBC_01813]WSA11090.1 peptidase M23 [Micromonospora sp. NBC_01813]
MTAFGATLRNRPGARLGLAFAVVCALGVVAAVESTEGSTAVDSANPPAQADLLRRADALDGASRAERADPAAGAAAAQPAVAATESAEPTAEATESAAAVDPDVAEEPAAPAEEPAPTIEPVAGMSQVQMDNATMIVDAGLTLQMPRRAMVIAVATAMQESTLLNRASEVLPESKNYPHQGTGWDHDSVGLFQQRTSTGWGAVADLMNPTYSATQFYLALQRVPGWQQLRLTEAAQAVQVSAYPEHYAQHETAAEAVVTEILAAR